MADLDDRDKEALLRRVNELVTANRTNSKPAANTGGLGELESGNMIKTVFGVAQDGLGKLADGSMGAADALHLTTGLISQFGTVAGLAGSALDKLGTGTIAVNQALNETGKYGVNLGNDLGLFNSSVKQAGLTMPEFTRLVERNATHLAGLGSNMNKSALAFLEIAEGVRTSDVGKQLQEAGMSAEELASATRSSMISQRAIARDDAASKRESIESALRFAQELNKTADISGKSRKEAEELVTQQQKRSEVESAMFLGGKDYAAATTLAQTSMSKWGKSLMEAYGDVVTGGPKDARGSNLQTALGSEVVAAMRRLDAANKTNNKEAQEAARKQLDAAMIARTNSVEFHETNRQLAGKYGEYSQMLSSLQSDTNRTAAAYQAGMAELAQEKPGTEITPEMAVDTAAFKQQMDQAGKKVNESGEIVDNSPAKLGRTINDIDMALKNGTAMLVGSFQDLNNKIGNTDGINSFQSKMRDLSSPEGVITEFNKKLSDASKVVGVAVDEFRKKYDIPEYNPTPPPPTTKESKGERASGTLGETGHPVELKDSILKIHKGETVVTPEQMKNLMSNISNSGAQHAMRESHELLKTITSNITPGGGSNITKMSDEALAANSRIVASENELQQKMAQTVAALGKEHPEKSLMELVKMKNADPEINQTKEDFNKLNAEIQARVSSLSKTIRDTGINEITATISEMVKSNNNVSNMAHEQYHVERLGVQKAFNDKEREQLKTHIQQVLSSLKEIVPSDFGTNNALDELSKLSSTLQNTTNIGNFTTEISKLTGINPAEINADDFKNEITQLKNNIGDGGKDVNNVISEHFKFYKNSNINFHKDLDADNADWDRQRLADTRQWKLEEGKSAEQLNAEILANKKQENAKLFEEAERARTVIGTSVAGIGEDAIAAMLPAGDTLERYYVDLDGKLQNYAADNAKKIEESSNAYSEIKLPDVTAFSETTKLLNDTSNIISSNAADSLSNAKEEEESSLMLLRDVGESKDWVFYKVIDTVSGLVKEITTDEKSARDYIKKNTHQNEEVRMSTLLSSLAPPGGFSHHRAVSNEVGDLYDPSKIREKTQSTNSQPAETKQKETSIFEDIGNFFSSQNKPAETKQKETSIFEDNGDFFSSQNKPAYSSGNVKYGVVPPEVSAEFNRNKDKLAEEISTEQEIQAYRKKVHESGMYSEESKKSLPKPDYTKLNELLAKKHGGSISEDSKLVIPQTAINKPTKVGSVPDAGKIATEQLNKNLGTSTSEWLRNLKTNFGKKHVTATEKPPLSSNIDKVKQAPSKPDLHKPDDKKDDISIKPVAHEISLKDINDQLIMLNISIKHLISHSESISDAASKTAKQTRTISGSRV